MTGLANCLDGVNDHRKVITEQEKNASRYIDRTDLYCHLDESAPGLFEVSGNRATSARL